MLAGRGQAFKYKKPGMIHEHCRYKGYLKEKCYKIIGYLPE